MWRDNADALEILLMQPRERLLLDYIDLPLVEMSAGVVASSRSVHGQYIRLIMVFGHNDQLPVDVYKRQVSSRGDGGIGILPQAEGAVRWKRKNKAAAPVIPLTGGSAYSLLIAWQKLSGVVA